MSFPALDDLRDVAGAQVLVRLDLNVPVRNGQVQDASRAEAAVPTLTWLLERGATVAACSHLGKPKGEPNPALSLQPVAPLLGELLGREVRFVSDCVGAPVHEALSSAAGGSMLLLENLRFHPGETANDEAFARDLATGYRHYVNDAFGTAHRAHASVAGVPSLFDTGHKAAGELMAAELKALGYLRSDPDRPYVAIIGGAKISTKTAPLEALLEQVNALLIGGGMANTFWLAQGREVGRSLVEREMIETAQHVLSTATERGIEVVLPTDVVVTDSIDSPQHVATMAADAVPPELMIVDLGPRSRELFRQRVAEAKTVFWNGPLGVFESEPFAAGTMAVASALAESSAFSVVGGGESVMAVHRAGVADKISHVSTGGGASLQLISGEPLPAVVALER
jgi:phosphoglycerate kinase